MHDDLVQRLRLRGERVTGPAIPLELEAADRIIALEAENEALRNERDHWESLVSNADHLIFPFVPFAPVNT